MNFVMFLLKIFIIMTPQSSTFAMEYIEEIINAIEGLSKNNLNHSSAHKNLSPKTYLVILPDGDSTSDEDGTLEKGSKEFKVRRRVPLNLKAQMTREERDEIKKAIKVNAQHQQKMDTVTEFMRDHYMTTVYLFNEVERIKRTREVTDKLRQMVQYVERRGKEAIRDAVIKCYQKARVAEGYKVDIWNRYKPNNLIINTFKDPENYGVIN